MERIYGLYETNSTGKLNIKEYFDQYTQAIRSGKNQLSTFLDEKHMIENEKRCSIELLQRDECLPASMKNRLPSQYLANTRDVQDNGLETLRQLKKKYSKCTTQSLGLSYKYQSEIAVKYDHPITTGIKAIPEEDILIFIRVYYPFTCYSGEVPRKRQRLSLQYVAGILGRQTLAEFRDNFHCISDTLMTVESSNNPNECIHTLNKDIYKSSFFYIENTFYNDMRHPECHDNSEVIRTWAKTRNLGPFSTEKMEDTRLDSLNVRFGFPWVFQHQGNCEHLIVFSGARLVLKSDDLAIANYPRVVRTKPGKHPICMMCSEFSAHWVVTQSNRVPHDTSYFCKKCFISYNYKDGKKIGEFKAYRYPYNPKLMDKIEAIKRKHGNES